MRAWSSACVRRWPRAEAPRPFTSAQSVASLHCPPFSSVTRSSSVPAETHVERSPMDRQQVFDLIRDRLADILEVEPASINEGDSFTDDLEADSLALIELAEALEEELGERSVGF